MDINLNNYKHYLSLYMKQELDPVKTAELMLFLSQNPGLENLTETAGSIKLRPDDSISFPQKNLLKKNFRNVNNINENNFDEFCIASSEGILSDYDENRFKDYVELHPEKKRHVKIYRQLKLKADPKVFYHGKSTLKKPVSIFSRYRIVLLATASMAASIALFIIIITGKPEHNVSFFTHSLNNGLPDTVIIYRKNPLEPHVKATVPEINSNNAEYVAYNNTTVDSDPVIRDKAEKPKADNISSIDPVHTIYLTSQLYANNFELDKTVNYDLNPDHSESGNEGIEGHETSGNKLFDYIRNLDAWETTCLAIKGINILTESSYSIEKVTNEQGRITRIIIDNEERTLFATGLRKQDL